MKLAILFLISNISGTSDCKIGMKELSKNITPNPLSIAPILRSIKEVYKNNKEQSVVLLLDKVEPFKVLFYLFDFDEEELFSLTTSRILSKCTYLEPSYDENNIDHLIKYFPMIYKFIDEDSFNLKKGKLYILFKEDIRKTIGQQAYCLIFRSCNPKQYQYESIKNVVMNNDNNDSKVNEIFLIITRLLHYVCIVLKENYRYFMTEEVKKMKNVTKIKLDRYGSIQKNIDTILGLLTNFDLQNDKYYTYLVLLQQFFKGIYGKSIDFKLEDEAFHNYFKIIILKNSIAKKFNNLKIVVEQNDIQLEKSFLDHILICIRRFLTIKLND